MSQKLKDRIDVYQDTFDFKLLSKLPIVIVVNGRNFTKTTSIIDKPYCTKFAECMLSASLKLCLEIEGSVFAYQYNDEIIIISKNDQSLETESWYDNKIQKICSIASSIATSAFKTHSNQLNLNIVGEPIFTTQVFTVPNLSEAVNTIIYKQQQNFHTSVQFASNYELSKKYSRDHIKDMLSGLTIDEKIDLLQQECNIDFNQYPISFRRGTACYKVPKILENKSMKNKWSINTELPIFAKNQSFIENILKVGHDIFRGE